MSVCNALEEHLRGWMVDCVLEFGSTARDEAVAGSDVDLWFIGHAPDRILLDTQWRGGRFADSIAGFLAHWPDVLVTDIDTWG
jgi:hypothetical protein